MPFVKAVGTHAPDVVMFQRLAVLPQWQCSTFMDPSDKDSAGNPILQRLTTYTGELALNNSAAGSHDDYSFEYPVLGTFDPGGVATIGIFPINVAGIPQFRSAVADVAVTDCSVEDTPSWLTVTNVAADLCEIKLKHPPPDPQFDIINAVVLSGNYTIRNIVLNKISYRVSVLERLTENTPALTPRFVGSPIWDGTYIRTGVAGYPTNFSVGPLKASGIPQHGL
jgi:hypothetical protein